jgi:hypothetical protein
MEQLEEEYAKEENILNKNEKKFDSYSELLRNYENKKALTKDYLSKLQGLNRIQFFA